MKFLFVARQKKNVDAYRTTIRRLLKDGHEVRLAIQERDPERDAKLAEEFTFPGFSMQSAPTARGDDWRIQAPLVRRLRDWAQYLRPPYAGADKLRLRVVDRLEGELALAREAFGDGLIRGLAPGQVERLADLLARIEAAIPPDPLHDEFVLRAAPDVVLVTPGVHFGSAQADIMKSARAAGIPVWMLAFSWDNLSTKGALHVAPDLMFVWNQRQGREATELHDVPAERVVVVGAPRFDEFFTLKPILSRARFHEPLGLDPDAPTLLYLCSSAFVSSHELPFVQRWLGALRASSDAGLRRCNVIVRPHPDIPLVEDDAPEVVHWPETPRAQGSVSRPFGDDRAVVLRTVYASQQAFFECIYHSAAVVGLNTTAELEAGIVGRPVFTVVADDEAVTGQSSTLHFHYLLREQGGFVVSASDLATHTEQLAAALGAPPEEASIRAFAKAFLRPRGDRPVGRLLAKELVGRFARLQSPVERRLQPAREEQHADVARGLQPPRDEDKPPRLLRVAYPGSSIRVAATPETRRQRRAGELALDPDTVAWLDEHVQPHDVVFDIGAGVGEYALIAAAHRGALVFAFEPGFAAHKRLCDNILLNDCRRSVVPLPMALGDRTGLLELEYEEDAPGEERHLLRARPWRMRPFGAEPYYAQPVCAERLDEVVARHRLPRPSHIRLRAPKGADAVLRGSVETLRNPDLTSLLLIAPRRQARAAIEDLLREAGLALVPAPSRREAVQVLRFVRGTAPMRRSWLQRR